MNGSIEFSEILDSVRYLYGLQKKRPEDVYTNFDKFTRAFPAEERQRAAGYKVLPHIHTEADSEDRRFAAEEGSRLKDYKSYQQSVYQRFFLEQEQNRQYFDLKRCKRLSNIQREIAQADYRRRMAALERRFYFKIKKAEKKPVFARGPMALPLHDLRSEHLGGNFAAFGIFLLKSGNSENCKLNGIWNEQVSPLLEDKLRNWIDSAYRDKMGIDNIRFYVVPVSNENMSGESLKETMRLFLDGMPTMLLESSVLPNEVSLSFTVWGLGADSSKDSRRFVFSRKALEMPPDSEEESHKAADRLAGWAADCFKTVIGCSFDAFSLAEYNQMPVFPKLLQNEPCGAADSILGERSGVREAEKLTKNIKRSSKKSGINNVNNIGGELVSDKNDLRKELINFYRSLYSLVLGPESGFAADYAHNKSANAYALRLSYAESMKGFLPPCQICAMLKDSADSWCSLRQSSCDRRLQLSLGEGSDGVADENCVPAICQFVGSLSADWLEKAVFGEYRLEDYFSQNDKKYIGKLTDFMFETITLKGERGYFPSRECCRYLPFLCLEICSRLFTAEKCFSIFAKLACIDGEGGLLEAALAEYPGAYFGNSAAAALVPGYIRRIGEGAFENSSLLRLLIIAEGVEAIGVRSFCGCGSLRYAQIAGTVKSIDAYAFEGCEELEEISIPDGVCSVGEYAFCGCKRLKKLFLPDSLEEIGEGALAGCYSLELVSFKGKIYTDCKGFNRALKDMGISGVFHIWSKGADEKLTAGEAYRIGAYEGYPVTEAVIPRNVKIVGDYAFSECTDLKRVVISGGVVSIGRRAFWRCAQLSSVVIEEHIALKTIDRLAFEGCDNLREIVLGDTVFSDADAFFEYFRNRYYSDWNMLPFSKSSDAFAPDEGKYAAKLALPVSSAGTSELKHSKDEILIEERSAIDNFAFYGCEGLKSAHLPVSVTSIGGYAFYGCTGLNELKLPVNAAFIGNSAFFRCRSLTDLTIPDKVSFIGNAGFAFCSSLKTVSLPEEITVIEFGVFYHCESLKEVKIPGKATSIRPFAFGGCKSLESVVLPDGLAEISPSAFAGCSNLKKIVFKGNVYSDVKSFYEDVKELVTDL